MRKEGKMQKSIKAAKNFILLILSMSLMFACPIHATAAIADNIATPAYITIDSNSAYISIKGIKATCTANIVSKRTASLQIKMELQKKKSSGYETVETWTSSKKDTAMSLTKSRNINVLCDYRLKVTYTADSENTVVYRYPS